MATVTRNVYVKVVAFDPAQGKMVPVPQATVLCEDSGWLWDPDLSTGDPATGPDGVAEVPITFDDAATDSLNPFFTITVPEAARQLPAADPADPHVTLPGEWVTRHYARKRLGGNLVAHTDRAAPLLLYVGLPANLRVSYTDFDASGKRNPMAIPEDTARIHLADYDEFLWIDWLDPDDVLAGFGRDRRGKVVEVGLRPEYPYYDRWPTAPRAADGVPAEPRAWLDPPSAPVASLGGGSFEGVGPLAIDPHGFVFMLDGGVVRRFYPDGTLCETIVPTGGPLNAPAGIAVDQYRNLFVAETGADRIHLFQPDREPRVLFGAMGPLGGPAGRYSRGYIGGAVTMGATGAAPGQFRSPRGMAVIPNPVVDGSEILAVCDPGNQRVQLFLISISGTFSTPQGSARMLSSPDVALVPLGGFGAAAPGPGQLAEPVG
ncbi:MAG: hypothetical protein JO040_12650, partial [Gemmatimonadetes bacterium]|nr:hypothetical protein [Gemmatimonadota bacterium]